jgi:hypothetical protein
MPEGKTMPEPGRKVMGIDRRELVGAMTAGAVAGTLLAGMTSSAKGKQR